MKGSKELCGNCSYEKYQRETEEKRRKKELAENRGGIGGKISRLISRRGRKSGDGDKKNGDEDVK